MNSFMYTHSTPLPLGWWVVCKSLLVLLLCGCLYTIQSLRGALAGVFYEHSTMLGVEEVRPLTRLRSAAAGRAPLDDGGRAARLRRIEGGPEATAPRRGTTSGR